MQLKICHIDCLIKKKDILAYLILCTLVTAAIVYFLCGMSENNDTKEDSKAGCITSLVWGFVMTGIMVLIMMLGKD